MQNDLSASRSVAIYARVSTEEQREGQTIDSQIAELERFCAEKNWRVAGIYKDEGWSGSLLARPELDRLRDDASLGKFDFVLVNDVDRLARDVSHLGILKRALERCGLEVVFRKLPTEKGPTSNLMINILGSFAEFERELIADRTRRGRRHKVEVRQQFLGTKAAYGYRYIPKNRLTGDEGYLEIVPDEVRVIKRMYQLVDHEGLSARKVVEHLNAYYQPPRNGKLWAKSTVLRILRSEIYAGVWYYNKHYSCEPERTTQKQKYKRPKSSTRLRPRSEWLALALPKHLQIIERSQWEHVQRQLTKNISFSPRNSTHIYLLKGLVRCGHCGGMYVGDPCHGKFYYRCLNRCRNFPTVREHILDETVWSAIVEVVGNPGLVFTQIAERQRRYEAEGQKTTDEEKEIEHALEQAREEESRILEVYRKSIISATQLASELEKLNSRMRSLQTRQHQLVDNKNKFSDVPVQRPVVHYCKQIAHQIGSFTKEQRQRLLRLLIESVVFEGQQITINGVFRLADLTARTAATSIYSRGHNSGAETPLEFNLVRSLPTHRDHKSVKLAA